LKLSPEELFITDILRSFVAGHPAGWTGAPLPTGLDWQAILAIGHYHNLLSLFYHEISRQGQAEQLPSWFRQQLRQEFLQNTAFTLLYEAVLGQVQDALDCQAIPFIILKGPSIAAEFYQPREVRPYVDLDVLINKDDYNRVKEVLERLDFYQPEAAFEEIQRQFFNCVNFRRHGEQQVALDLQWDTLLVSWNDHSFLKGEQVWQNRRWLDFDGRSLPVLQPEALVVYLSIHLAVHHQFARLLSLLDLDLVIRRHAARIDWHEVVNLALKMRICKPLFYSFKLAVDLLGSPLPKEVLAELEQPAYEKYLLPIQTLAFKTKPLAKPFELAVKYLLIDRFPERFKAVRVYFQKARARKNVKAS